jgi:DNA-binding HxlR family transcriptional regulator
MPSMPDQPTPTGPFNPSFLAATELIGKRWTAAIVWAIHHGHNRFGDLQHNIPGLSARMLSERLKELEAEEILERNVYAETPVRIEYQLTEKGRALREVFVALSRWAIHWNRQENA